MSSIPEQLATATKSHLDAQLALVNALTGKAFEGVQKVIELHLDATKASMQEVADTMKQTGTAQGSQDLLSTAAEKAQPNVEKAIDYSRRLAELAANMQAEFAKATEAQVAETTRTLTSLMDEASRNVSPGSENTIAMMKAMIDNANAGYEQLAKNARLAVDALKASVDTAASQIAQAAETIRQTANK